MSSFSSVVHKPGQKIQPKVAPRRNVQRKSATVVTKVSTDPASARVTSPSVFTAESHPIEHSAYHADAGRSTYAGNSPDSTPDEPSSTTAQNDRRGNQLADSKLSSEALERPQSRVATGVENENEQDTQVTSDNPLNLRVKRRKHNKVAERQKRKTIDKHGPSTLLAPTQEQHSESRVAQVHITSPFNRGRNKSTQGSSLSASADIILDPTNKSTAQSSPTLIPPPGSDLAQPISDAFKSITTQLESISGTLNNIYRPGVLSHAQERDATRHIGLLEGPLGSRHANHMSKQKKRKRSIQDQAAEVITNAIGDSNDHSRNRASTPEDAENYELNPFEVSMADLTQDRKLGKKSVLEAEMQANWPEIIKRRREELEQARHAAQKRSRARAPPPELPSEVAEQQVARTRIVNGRIVLDEETREVDRSRQLVQTATQDADTVREDKIYYKRVNQATVGMKPGYGQRYRWDEQSTDRFFKGLRMFGTDFLMIANMFPGLDRKHIKNKFIREENADKAKVMEHLSNKEEVDLNEYAKETEISLNDVDVIEREMQAEEERLRKEDDERRNREGFVRNPGPETILPSTEHDDVESADVDGPGRFAREAAEIMAPGETRKRQRKTALVGKRRGPRMGRYPAEGVEEALGSIDEVRV